MLPTFFVTFKDLHGGVLHHWFNKTNSYNVAFGSVFA